MLGWTCPGDSSVDQPFKASDAYVGLQILEAGRHTRSWTQMHGADLEAFRNIGCDVSSEAAFVVMKSPIGPKLFCEQEVSKRVVEAERIIKEIADLPDHHVAFYLLRYQISRMDYVIRTTPKNACKGALETFESVVRGAFEKVIGKTLDEAQWRQATLPQRLAGCGLRSIVDLADAAYYA